MTTLKLRPEIKARLIEALRSNKYKQGKNRLRFGDCFCSLGVLADLAVQDGVARWLENTLQVGTAGYNIYFPNCLLDWACGTEQGNLTESLTKCFYHFNDSCDMSFEKIANLLQHSL